MILRGGYTSVHLGGNETLQFIVASQGVFKVKSSGLPILTDKIQQTNGKWTVKAFSRPGAVTQGRMGSPHRQHVGSNAPSKDI